MLALKPDLDQIHQRVRAHFIEKRDHGEHWQMPPENYNGEQILRDDCDGFCLAVRKLLRDLNIASRLVYCEVAGVGHLVVEVQGWILDNRQKEVLANTLLINLGYRFLRISGYQAGEPWRLIL